ncbi:hypothetical protein HDV02_004689 [Globomyces sp. JEL0801]|nr:hypothetical protein HDV02_004689 [Globomyces sp. JEL0801]
MDYIPVVVATTVFLSLPIAYLFYTPFVSLLPASKRSHRLYYSNTNHVRFHPKQHSFTYPVVYIGFNLDSLHNMPSLISHNSWNLFSINDVNYIDSGKQSIKSKLFDLLLAFNIDTSNIGTVELVTQPKFLFINFNPLNVYYCFNKESNDLYLVLLEVNNTFGERHWYLCNQQNKWEKIGSKYDAGSFTFTKQFHVSPFNDMEGCYDCHILDISKHDSMDLLLRLMKDGELHLKARMWGKAVDLSAFNLLKASVTCFISLVSTFPRIHKEALYLFVKGLSLYSKPEQLKQFPTGFKN